MAVLSDPEGHKRHAPMDVDCGDVFRIEDRRADVRWTRDMSGPVGVMGKRADRRPCDRDAKFSVRVADGVYVGVCGQHSAHNVR